MQECSPGALGVNLVVEEMETDTKYVVKQVRNRAPGAMGGSL